MGAGLLLPLSSPTFNFCTLKKTSLSWFSSSALQRGALYLEGISQLSCLNLCLCLLLPDSCEILLCSERFVSTCHTKLSALLEGSVHFRGLPQQFCPWSWHTYPCALGEEPRQRAGRWRRFALLQDFQHSSQTC